MKLFRLFILLVFFNALNSCTSDSNEVFPDTYNKGTESAAKAGCSMYYQSQTGWIMLGNVQKTFNVIAGRSGKVIVSNGTGGAINAVIPGSSDMAYTLNAGQVKTIDIGSYPSSSEAIIITGYNLAVKNFTVQVGYCN
ncbi:MULTISPECIES: hypothetical protein [unclassified Chryseobacterium]|uniref:hypothetical protein n=1 Tax=unclassified Chryseobacterium TaxID=2593645 RepID=UPI000D4B3203|nr:MULTISPECIES: hypothetical protein [unclassified Chryseobacterium]PTT74652.1 hypothetical protein DBR25_10325 [Chryseobacterium sp. HMWF001]PVV55184.1 hypothetical protein DD829_15510 [Chryseobacterium sp. HMWF035]